MILEVICFVQQSMTRQCNTACYYITASLCVTPCQDRITGSRSFDRYVDRRFMISSISFSFRGVGGI